MKSILQSRLKEIEAIELTPEEREQAILAAKAKKWHYERSREWWEEQEKKKSKQIG